jgi:hypothetical protein
MRDASIILLYYLHRKCSINFQIVAAVAVAVVAVILYFLVDR